MPHLSAPIQFLQHLWFAMIATRGSDIRGTAHSPTRAGSKPRGPAVPFYGAKPSPKDHRHLLASRWVPRGDGRLASPVKRLRPPATRTRVGLYCSDVADAAAIVKVFHAVEGRTALDAMKELRAMDNKHKVMREAAKAESEEIRARLRIVEFEWDRFLKQQLGDLPKGEDFRRLGDKMAATRKERMQIENRLDRWHKESGVPSDRGGPVSATERWGLLDESATLNEVHSEIHMKDTLASELKELIKSYAKVCTYIYGARNTRV